MAIEASVIIGTAVVLLATTFALRLRYSSGRRKPAPTSIVYGAGDDPVSSALQLRINPFRDLSFEESLNTAEFSAAVERSVEAVVRGALGPDAVNAAINIAVTNSTDVLVKFKDTPYKLMESGGSLKAIAVDSTNKITQIGTVDGVGTVVNRLSHASSAVVAVAHMISNADLARRMSVLECLAAQQLEAREGDIYAKLRQTYESLRAYMNTPTQAVNNIARHRDEFRYQRHRLFGDAQRAAANLPPLPRFSLTKKKAMRQRRESLDAVMIKLQLASYCLRMEAIAATLFGAEEDQALLYREAVTEWRALTKQIQSLEHEAEGGVQVANQLRNATDAWANIGASDETVESPR